MTSAAPHALALFPGAFQPPHGAHLAAVRYLAGRTDVGEVVVIISNRNRGIPGTAQSLDAGLSQRIWSVYLEGMRNVRTEIAPHTAVDHALDYLRRVPSGQRLLFCIGEQDRRDGDGRFEDLPRQARAAGVEASVVEAPTAGIRVRATGLRRSLARGEDGRQAFIDGLPQALSDEQRQRVWRLCREGLRDVCDLALERLLPRLDDAGIGVVSSASCVDRGRIDPVFRLRMQDGRRLLVRYAGDAEGADGGDGHGMARKPRRALKVERRALELLLGHRGFGLALARPQWFERRLGVLVMDDLLPDGSTLAERIAQGHAIAPPMALLGCFLAGCHALEPQALRNSGEEDVAHWQARLQGVESAWLRQAGGEAGRKALLWLHAVAGAVRIEGDRTGVVDFEHAGSWGDPACDLGTLIGDCLALASRADACATVHEGVEALLDAYRERAGDDAERVRRVVGWAAERVGAQAARDPALQALADRLRACAEDPAGDPGRRLGALLRADAGPVELRPPRSTEV